MTEAAFDTTEAASRAASTAQTALERAAAAVSTQVTEDASATACDPEVHPVVEPPLDAADTMEPERAPTGGGTGDSDHEALLRRHGLISHVARLPTGTAPDDVARFRDDAARVARNVIALAPDRFGLLLDGASGAPGAMPLSEIPHSLSPGGAPDAPNPPVTSAGPEVDTEAAMPSPGSTGMLGIDTEIATRLSALDARLDALSPEAMLASIAPAIDDLLEARLDALGARLGPARTPAHPPPGVLQQDRVDAVWAGMEDAIRLIGTMARRAAEAAEATEAAGRALAERSEEPSSTIELTELETAVGLGFEAAGEAREADHATLLGHLTALESRLGSAISDKLLPPPDPSAALVEQIEGLCVAVDGLREGVGSPDRNVLTALDQRLDALVAHLGNPASTLAMIVDRLDTIAASSTQDAPRLEKLSADLERLDQKIAGTLCAPEDLVAVLAERIDTLGARLESRGGVLSDALDTSHRSMKNFWLAAEDALGRLDTALRRLDPPDQTRAECLDSPRDGIEAGKDSSDDQAVPLSAQLPSIDRLTIIEARLEAAAEESVMQRRALAELLARVMPNDGSGPRDG